MNIAVYLYMLFLYVRPQDWVEGFIGFPTATIVIPLGLLIGFSQYRKNPDYYKIPQNKLFIYYLIVIFVATLLAVDFYSGRLQFIEFLKRILVFYMMIWTINTEKRLRNVLIVMAALSAFLAYQAILQATTGQSWGGLTVYPGYDVIRVRWYGDWDGPNVYGLLFVMACAIAAGMMFGHHKLFTRLAGFALFSLYFTAIYFTNSRGAILAVLASIFFYFIIRIKNKIKFLIYSPIVLLPLLFLAPSRMSEVSSDEESAHQRTWLWEQGLAMLKENPVFGIGRGEFANNTDLKLIAHNNYVQNFAELGLVGFFLFISILWFTFKGNYVSVKNMEASPLRSLNQIMLMMMVGYASATFFIVMELDLFYFFLGLASATYLVSRDKVKVIPKIEFTKNDLIIIFSSMFGLIFVIWVAAVLEIV